MFKLHELLSSIKDDTDNLEGTSVEDEDLESFKSVFREFLIDIRKAREK